jgi:hypothetical protein
VSAEDAEGCNGWTNYATWTCASELDNDEASYGRVIGLASRIATQESSHDRRVAELASAIRRYTGARRGVNYREIAEGYLEELPK